MKDYERKYKQALIRATREFDCAQTDSTKNVIQTIFPELLESEDERIRKWLIEMVEELIKVNPDNEDHYGMCSDAIAWLKGEQRSDCGISAITQKKLKDRVERKGMNIVEEDMTPFQKKVFCIIDSTIEEEQGLKQVCDELLRLAHKEQKPAWSEEDESMFEGIKWSLVDLEVKEQSKGKFAQEIDWLKSLKDRVQPKQEWSEEDNVMLISIENILIGRGHSFYDKEINWLKSLRPQNTWKPSAFHLGCITDAISMYKDRGINAIGLKEVLDELKKLKEE